MNTWHVTRRYLQQLQGRRADKYGFNELACGSAMRQGDFAYIHTGNDLTGLEALEFQASSMAKHPVSCKKCKEQFDLAVKELT